MDISNIATVFTTADHKVIASRYERCLYGEPEQMFVDLKNDINLQFDNYDNITMFSLVIEKDGESGTCKIFEPPIDRQDIIDYVDSLIED